MAKKRTRSQRPSSESEAPSLAPEPLDAPSADTHGMPDTSYVGGVRGQEQPSRPHTGAHTGSRLDVEHALRMLAHAVTQETGHTADMTDEASAALALPPAWAIEAQSWRGRTLSELDEALSMLAAGGSPPMQGASVGSGTMDAVRDTEPPDAAAPQGQHVEHAAPHHASEPARQTVQPATDTASEALHDAVEEEIEVEEYDLHTGEIMIDPLDSTPEPPLDHTPEPTPDPTGDDVPVSASEPESQPFEESPRLDTKTRANFFKKLFKK
jgi:hypothetical protein